MGRFDHQYTYTVFLGLTNTCCNHNAHLPSSFSRHNMWRPDQWSLLHDWFDWWYESQEKLTLFVFVCLEFHLPCLPPPDCLSKHTNTIKILHYKNNTTAMKNTQIHQNIDTGLVWLFWIPHTMSFPCRRLGQTDTNTESINTRKFTSTRHGRHL